MSAAPTSEWCEREPGLKALRDRLKQLTPEQFERVRNRVHGLLQRKRQQTIIVVPPASSGPSFKDCEFHGPVAFGGKLEGMTMPLPAPPGTQAASTTSTPEVDESTRVLKKREKPSIQTLRENTLKIVDQLQYREGDPASTPFNLYGFWEQLQDPDRVSGLLKDVEKLSGITTSHPSFEKKHFEGGLNELDENQLSQLGKALEWVRREGVMSHFDFERASYNTIFLFADSSGETFSNAQELEDFERKAALGFQLTSQADLQIKRTAAVKRIVTACRSLGFTDVNELEDLPPIVHAMDGLMAFLNDMGTLNGSSRFTTHPHKIDVTTANLLVLASAIESSILIPSDEKSVLKFKTGKEWIFYDRDKDFPNQHGFSDIPKIETHDKVKRYFRRY